MVADDRPPSRHSCPSLLAAGALGCIAAFPTALSAPLSYPPMVPGQQHLGHAPATMLRRAGVVGILRISVERDAEGLLGDRLLVSERAWKLAQNGVAHDHRRQ